MKEGARGGTAGSPALSKLHQLAERGQSVWIDFLSREFVHGGELARMVEEDAVTGITSNPTIFQQAIAKGREYDDQLRELLAERDDPAEVFFALAVDDVRDACDVLRPIWERTAGGDGYVSLEVDPTLAFKTDETLEQAVALHDSVARPNVLIKIPATVPGLPAIEGAIARGVSINITLIFSVERYRAVVEAYLRGLERLLEDGGDPARVASVASFFVSRLDTEADRRLAERGYDALQGKLGVANAKLAYRHFEEVFAGARWEALAARGATEQRPLWASTSTKNPVYPDTLYVTELVGPDTVNTMPPETVQAFQDHGELRGDTVREGVEEAGRLLDELRAVGVDYDDVVATLEAEGVDKFVASFDELIEGIRAKQGELART
jgi:transaldolase